jgi:hypothetical protein
MAKDHVIESAPEPPADPERVLAHAFTLQNGIFRLGDHRPAIGALMLLTFRYTARSDEKREGLVTLGLNLDTGSLFAGDFLTKLETRLSYETEWRAPSSSDRAAIPDAGVLARRLEPALDALIRRDLANFEASMTRRLDRDAARVHAFHDDLRRAAQKKLGALGAGTDEKTESQRRRDMLRIEAIEREYAAKTDDLRRNYAMSIGIEFTQGLLLFAPVERYEILIKRRKGERSIVMDWHKALRLMEPPPADCGACLDRVRYACDDHLHLTDAQGQAPCCSCAKAYCRACHPDACPRCGAKMTSVSAQGSESLSRLQERECIGVSRVSQKKEARPSGRAS